MRKYLYLFVLMIAVNIVFAGSIYEKQHTNKNHDYINEMKPDFETFPFIFDTLSASDKAEYVEMNRKKIPELVYENFDQYSKFNIQQLDYVFDILVAADIINAERDVIPLYVYIMKEVNVDGATGEYVTDMYYDLFFKFPGYFYQYMDYLKQNGLTDTFGDLAYCVAFNTGFTDIDYGGFKGIMLIHKQKLPQYVELITSIEQDIQRYIDEGF